MAVFGLVRLEHIPPKRKMHFGGSGGSGGSRGPPGDAFLHTFRVFLQKSLNRFMKEVEIEYSVLKTHNIFV